ncbi:[Ribosomal protein S18]-alanine N-acetyltransferase [Candidatus Entotheonellaceae bacterium PAL068K]
MTPGLLSAGMAIRFEPMRVEDLETILAIERQSFTMPWSRAMFVSELANTRTSCLFVAHAGEAQDIAVGYLVYRVVIDEMHIVLVSVDPAWRRCGIARHMMERAMDQARQATCCRATLEVRVSNTGAQRLYFQLGFAPVGTRPGYYRRPTEDALILWRDPL